MTRMATSWNSTWIDRRLGRRTCAVGERRDRTPLNLVEESLKGCCNILLKLGTDDRTHAVMIVLERRLIDLLWDPSK